MSNHEADIENNNDGTEGINETRQKALDNKSEQLDPQNPKHQPKVKTSDVKKEK